jgi:uncharacterized repeat protein (TIGR04138 family)
MSREETSPAQDCAGAAHVFFCGQMPELDVNEIISLIRKEDPRFDRLAYTFVRDGLEHAVKELKKRDAARARISKHVSGRELAEGLRDYAIEQFGPLAKTVLNAWGVSETIHFGDIVYNLIDYNIFSKTESDRREDFSDIYDFEDAFERPFRPQSRRLPLPSFAEADAD